ncbi:14618_t:CDS:2, partial [Racocetra persica]
GVYTSSEELQRQTSIWLIDYPFELYAEQQSINISEMTASRSCSQEIISTICQNSLSLLVINKDIYNICDHLCKKSLESYTLVEALIDKLREDGY